MTLRRVVVMQSPDGRARIAHDGEPPRTHRFTHAPGNVTSIMWATDPTSRSDEDADTSLAVTSVVPPVGSTVFRILTFPPAASQGGAPSDVAAALRERAEHSPGLLQYFRDPTTGMHATPSVDYIIMLEGELTLVLDDGTETILTSGDTLVQLATLHAWVNRSSAPATFACISTGVIAPRTAT